MFKYCEHHNTAIHGQYGTCAKCDQEAEEGLKETKYKNPYYFECIHCGVQFTTRKHGIDHLQRCSVRFKKLYENEKRTTEKLNEELLAVTTAYLDLQREHENK